MTAASSAPAALSAATVGSTLQCTHTAFVSIPGCNILTGCCCAWFLIALTDPAVHCTDNADLLHRAQSPVLLAHLPCNPVEVLLLAFKATCHHSSRPPPSTCWHSCCWCTSGQQHCAASGPAASLMQHPSTA
jgi:hypothetical protein